MFKSHTQNGNGLFFHSRTVIYPPLRQSHLCKKSTWCVTVIPGVPSMQTPAAILVHTPSHALRSALISHQHRYTENADYVKHLYILDLGPWCTLPHVYLETDSLKRNSLCKASVNASKIKTKKLPLNPSSKMTHATIKLQPHQSSSRSLSKLSPLSMLRRLNLLKLSMLLRLIASKLLRIALLAGF